MSIPPPCTPHAKTFDSGDYRDHIKARAICARCPQVAACLNLALEISSEHTQADRSRRGPDGTWGGLLWKDGSIQVAAVVESAVAA